MMQMEENDLNVELRKLISEAENQPGIADLMAVYCRLNEVYLVGQQIIRALRPRMMVYSSNDTSQR